MRILIPGASGMLGREVAHAAARRGHEIATIERNGYDVRHFEQSEYWLRTVAADVVINCTGIVPQRVGDGTPEIEMVETNALAPFLIAEACRLHEAHLVHVSTDCVFDGVTRDRRPWLTSDTPNARDLYGRSKGMAELVTEAGATVVRTSFIGPAHGLWDWYVNHDGPVQGYTMATWSGATVDAVAEGLVTIAEQQPGGVQHLSTQRPISKAHVLGLLKRALGGPEIEDSAVPVLNRWLHPTYVLPELTFGQIQALA